MSEEILYGIADGVARVTINRPERLNAFTLDGARRMLECFSAAADDTGVGVVVLTGAGERPFCTGGDVGDFEAFTIEVDRAMNATLLCDLTIASDRSRFGQTGPKMGSAPNWRVTQLLPRAVGEKRAREIVYLCEQYSAEQAREMGWVNRVVPAAELDAAVDTWCASLLAKNPTALRLAKMALNQASDQLGGAVTQGMELLTFFHDTAESREGMQALMEKRAPVFRPAAPAGGVAT